MNFFANPIPHWPTGCYQVLLGATGSVEQRVLPRSCFFFMIQCQWGYHTIKTLNLAYVLSVGEPRDFGLGFASSPGGWSDTG